MPQTHWFHFVRTRCIIERSELVWDITASDDRGGD